MPPTLQALLVLSVAVLPGAIYLWGFEREAGKWGIGLSDQLLRFVAASSIFLALWSVPLYVLYHRYVHHRHEDAAGKTTFVNHLADGSLPAWLGLVPLLYVGIPVALGTLAGVGARRKSGKLRTFARVAAGRDPAPRAWDALFADRSTGLVRLRLKEDGGWVGGWFGTASYAAGYPEAQDLLLEQRYAMQDDGSFVRDEEGRTQVVGSQVLVRWEEADLLEFFIDED